VGNQLVNLLLAADTTQVTEFTFLAFLSSFQTLITTQWYQTEEKICIAAAATEVEKSVGVFMTGLGRPLAAYFAFLQTCVN
jgi:hypothetical protein